MEEPLEWQTSDVLEYSKENATMYKEMITTDVLGLLVHIGFMGKISIFSKSIQRLLLRDSTTVIEY